MIRKRVYKMLILSIISLLLICIIALYLVTAYAYKSSFNQRFTTEASSRFSIINFPNMVRERHTFKSNNNQTLVGYLYENIDTTIDKKGVVVFAHGYGGGGQIGYINIFDILVQNGYCVFAYDATANDESEGEAVGGLPQGYIDLDYAISYAQTIEEIKSLPFVLMGYSWGGLSVTNVLNYHPEIKAVASLAGFNKSINLIEYNGCNMFGNIAKVLTPFVATYEFFKYGKYAFSSSLKGFEKSDCGVMIIHSEDDTIVPIKYGYDLYYEKHNNNKNFEFYKYTDRGHSIFSNIDQTLDVNLIEYIVEFFDKNISKYN